ncbi:MAG: hypothetical protein JSV34_01805 [Candidatus Omnitrophota bacterium]|nr:MAG: hypothetical protein JSV34_01805 [Candidatus Omnitrophota bacterium]
MVDASQRIRDLREITIVIDTWDDVFSDFDPRPLSDRTLSEDFISELKKRYRETRKGDFIVKLYAPFSLKDERSENMVAQRLKKHFRHRFLQRQKDIVRIRAKGVIFVVSGICFLTFLMLITYFKVFSQLAIEMLSIIFMPLGWFGIWEGFSKIVDTSPAFIQEEVLFNKLSRAAYRFEYVQENK